MNGKLRVIGLALRGEDVLHPLAEKWTFETAGKSYKFISFGFIAQFVHCQVVIVIFDSRKKYLQRYILFFRPIDPKFYSFKNKTEIARELVLIMLTGTKTPQRIAFLKQSDGSIQLVTRGFYTLNKLTKRDHAILLIKRAMIFGGLLGATWLGLSYMF